MANHNRRNGFTLLELLVAFAIASLIVVAAYGAFFSLNNAQQVAEKDMLERRSQRALLDLMRRELSSVLYRAGDKKLRFLVEDRDIFGKPASNLSFTSITQPLYGMASDQSLIRYKVLESGERLVLTRSARDYFSDENLLGQEEQTDSTTIDRNSYPVLEELDSFMVECFDGSQWLKNWNTDLTPTLPMAIRITFTLYDKGQTVSHRIIAIPKVTGQ